jgi:hypothetical protein
MVEHKSDEIMQDWKDCIWKYVYTSLNEVHLSKLACGNIVFFALWLIYSNLILFHNNLYAHNLLCSTLLFNNVKIKMYRAIMLPAVWRPCAICSFLLMKEPGLRVRVSANGVLRKMLRTS